MKQYLKILLCAFAGMSLLACQNDDEEPIKPIPQPKIEGTLIDGGQISSISLYCLDDSRKIGELWYDFYKRTKTVKNYSAFELYAEVERYIPTYESDNMDEMAEIQKLEEAYYESKTSFIIEDYRKEESNNNSGWPYFFTAYVNGEVSITCDKMLYGEAPGTNLSKHFEITTSYQGCLPMGIEKPRYLCSYEDEKPTSMDLYFAKEVWIEPYYNFRLIDMPSEKYDNLTLRLSIPMVKDHSRNYFVAQYKGLELPDRYTEEVFTAECLINFDWD